MSQLPVKTNRNQTKTIEGEARILIKLKNMFNDKTK